ncbi:MAG: hypothetical protein LLF97_06800 [Planctomycetaceae bacterium]|nr:hypothetical protein [Planctomycetaceae bacterium]
MVAKIDVTGKGTEPGREVYRLTLQLSEFGDGKFRIEKTSQPPANDFQGTPFNLNRWPKTKATKGKDGMFRLVHDFSDADDLDVLSLFPPVHVTVDKEAGLLVFRTGPLQGNGEVKNGATLDYGKKFRLRNDPLAQAVASRVTRLEHEPTDQEIAAFMRRLAADGYKDLWPDQCQEVTEFLIDETRAFDGRLDLRHLTKAWEDRRQWEDDNCESSWEDLVRSSLGKIVVWNEGNPFSKREDIAQQRERVAEALRLFPGDVDKQMEFSGLKKSTFYKRRKEVGSAA